MKIKIKIKLYESKLIKGVNKIMILKNIKTFNKSNQTIILNSKEYLQ